MALNFVHIFVLVLSVSTALALTCYRCDSSQNKICNYGIGSFTYDTVDCNAEAGIGVFTNWISKQCIKYVVTAKDGSEYIGRGCMPNVGQTACRAGAKILGLFSGIEGEVENMDCFTCNEDKCNSATTYTGYTMLGVLLAALAFLF